MDFFQVIFNCSIYLFSKIVNYICIYLDKSNGVTKQSNGVVKPLNGLTKPLNGINNIKKINVKEKKGNIYDKWDSNIKQYVKLQYASSLDILIFYTLLLCL